MAREEARSPPQRSWCQSHSEGSAQKISHGSASYQQLSPSTKALRSGSKGKLGEGRTASHELQGTAEFGTSSTGSPNTRSFHQGPLDWSMAEGKNFTKTLKRQYKEQRVEINDDPSRSNIIIWLINLP